jgi:hypothetical protein
MRLREDLTSRIAEEAGVSGDDTIDALKERSVCGTYQSKVLGMSSSGDHRAKQHTYK